jgi:hypothetical protein
MKFFLAQPLALRWKNLMHVSPSFSQTRREACRHCERSIAVRPRIRHLRSLHKQSSSAVSCLISCAMSNRWMILLAMCSSMRALPNSLLLQALRTRVVGCILKNKIFNGEIPGTCSVPCALHDLHEPWYSDPEVFKAEPLLLFWSGLLTQKQWAVIG